MKVYRTVVDLEHYAVTFHSTKAAAFAAARVHKLRADFLGIYVDQIEAPTTQEAIVAYLSKDYEDLRVVTSWRLRSTGGMYAVNDELEKEGE